MDAAVDQAGVGDAGEFEAEAEIEILERAGGREEVVVRDLLGERAAGEGAVLDAPPGLVAFPAGEGAAVEEDERLGGGEAGADEEKEEGQQRRTAGHGGVVKLSCAVGGRGKGER